MAEETEWLRFQPQTGSAQKGATLGLSGLRILSASRQTVQPWYGKRFDLNVEPTSGAIMLARHKDGWCSLGLRKSITGENLIVYPMKRVATFLREALGVTDNRIVLFQIRRINDNELRLDATCSFRPTRGYKKKPTSG